MKRGMIKRGKKETHILAYLGKIIKPKTAQSVFGMSFEMIFSILLIIAFIGLAIYVIIYFLDLKNCTEETLFVQDLQDAIDEVWKVSSKTAEFSQPLPVKIEFVCFVDFDKSGQGEIYDELKRYQGENRIYFYPTRKACNRYYTINHINISLITEQENPYCSANTGKPILKLSKDFYQPLVKIE